MSPGRNRNLEEIIRWYLERYPERADLLVRLVEFWARLHALNENISSLLSDLRRSNAELRALGERAEASLAHLHQHVEDEQADDPQPDDKEEEEEEGEEERN